MDEATLNQVRAAAPDASTWLSANAGSGKTKVLTDRVARLLLRGTPPQRILCLTYTKAAASEMQNRLFKRLGEWAMLPDARLTEALHALGEEVSDTDILLRARRLFARAIETPGGLKIQTIHAFCSALLRRFPLEAAVPPDFTEVEERSLQELRMEVLDGFAQGSGGAAMRDLMERLDERSFAAFLAGLGRFRDAFEGPEPDLHALFDLPKGYDAETLRGEAFDGGEGDLFAAVQPYLRAGKKTDTDLAVALALIGQPDLNDLETLERKLLFGAGAKVPYGAKIGKLPTGATRAAIPDDLMQAFDDLMQRVEDVRPRRLALASLSLAKTLHRFARLWLPAFDEAKRKRGWLDFDDLIRLARRLLGVSSVAQWVLFKLDGGIDHILVDEAQDTSPDQWHVIDLLTQEFTAGQGARSEERTIFVVGDRKQSIYSFQGADLHGFEDTRNRFRERLAQVGVGLGELELLHSFRSSDAVLRLVDLCFSGETGSGGLGDTPRHLAFHAAKPGRVDLWPVLPKPQKEEDQPWDDPLDRPAVSNPDIVLAQAIAAEIHAMIDRGDQIETGYGPRAVHEGDFLILVRRRKLLFDSLIRACKAQGLEIAGADRLVLTEEPAVQDLIALLKFLALPEDDLSLAVILRSPLFGWSEDRLFRLAHSRGARFLWEALRTDPLAEDARVVLDDLRDQVDFLRPYELIERVLTRHDGRRRIRARFGAEIDEALEAFVDLALTYERGHIPSLDGFLTWLEASDAEIKRQSESAGRRIRVMTVHGAKGLEAPIVILPDTASRKEPQPGPVVVAEGVPILRAVKDDATMAQRQADDQAARLRDDELDRLLYVALTRSETWLIVAAAGDVDDPGCWYGRVSAAVRELAPLPLETRLGPGWRHQHGLWPPPVGVGAAPEVDAAEPVALAPVPPVIEPPALLTPTALGGAKALPGEGDDTATALARGQTLHMLLEMLPGLPPESRRSRGLQALAQGGQWAQSIEMLVEEALAAIDDPAVAPMLAPGALAEVTLSGIWEGRPIWGVIDRLIVEPDRVLAVDFKSNRVVPGDPAQVPEGLLRQMGAYAHMLQGLYPGRRVETALVWTARAPRLMPLPADLVAAALGRATLDPDVVSS